MHVNMQISVHWQPAVAQTQCCSSIKRLYHIKAKDKLRTSCTKDKSNISGSSPHLVLSQHVTNPGQLHEHP